MLHHVTELLRCCWNWHSAPPDLHHIEQAGFVFAIVGAILQGFLTTFQWVGKYVLDIAGIVFDTIEAATRFGLRGVTWLTGLVRKGYSLVSLGLEHTFGYMQSWIKSIYSYAERVRKYMENTFAPIIKTVQTIKRWYDLVWKRVVQPIINAIQRVRQVLAIFKFFHLKWAEKLDANLAHLEFKIAENFLVFRRYVNLLGSWTDFLIDPFGAIRWFPMLSGFIGALDVTFAGLFGTHFHWFEPGTGPLGRAASVKDTFRRDLEQIRTGTGDAGTVQRQWKTQHDSVRVEMGLS